MPKPNGDNRLTKDLLKLRGILPEPEAEPSGFSIEVNLKGPDFEFRAQAKGAPWIVRKLLQDLDVSIEQLW